jgi:hypothetical protein
VSLNDDPQTSSEIEHLRTQLAQVRTALNVPSTDAALAKIAAYQMLIFEVRKAYETYSGQPPIWLTVLAVSADTAERAGLTQEGVNGPESGAAP